jgi:uncharacterized protein YaaW (UPF0174 family)
MAQRDYSEYQQKIISKYYSSLDTLMLQKLQALVSELYLADSDTKKDRLWKRVQKAMENLEIPSPIMEHILSTRDVEVLARNLQDWLKHAGGKH